MPYAAYILIAVIVLPGLERKWFLRRKWRQWARLLDADQDGVISPDDMKNTNAKLEQLRKIIGVRKTALSDENKKKWWNENIFKNGPGKDTGVYQSMTTLVSWMGPLEQPPLVID
ncbi:sarcoplasmic calcium-binding protein-like [Saccostrea cucullata]|uniref:sarcoplasmic calcium-binding protein-like n=1 Tax=Saccostrea cuccullata TaxID=36930 RepID=UPI002ED2BCDE